MEPETSRIRSRRRRWTRRRRQARSMGSPPVRMARRRVRRRSGSPVRAARRRRVRRTGARTRRRAIIRAIWASSASLHPAKFLRRSVSTGLARAVSDEPSSGATAPRSVGTVTRWRWSGTGSDGGSGRSGRPNTEAKARSKAATSSRREIERRPRGPVEVVGIDGGRRPCEHHQAAGADRYPGGAQGLRQVADPAERLGAVRDAHPRRCSIRARRAIAMSSRPLIAQPSVSAAESGVHRPDAERGERAGPVDGLGRAGGLGQVELAQAPDELGHRLGQGLRRLRRAQPDDLDLALAVRVVDPVVEAAALERVVQLAGAVGGEDHHRRRLGDHGPDLGDGHRGVGQHLQQEGLELLVGPVELVDQEHRPAPCADGRQQRPLDQELRAVELGGLAVGVERPLLQRARVEELARVVPLVERLAGVDPLVALEADEPRRQRPRERPRDLGLADPRLALEEQRPAAASAPGRRTRPARGRRCSARARGPAGAARRR